jgi:Ca2+-binding EF-hand superfamily protein
MKQSPTFTSFLLAGALALVAGPAFAGHEDDDAKFQKMDTNGDGRVSRSEHASGAKNMFVEMDANRDGAVTAAEMDARHAQKKSADSAPRYNSDPARAADGSAVADEGVAAKIRLIDQNGDGQLSASEHEAGTTRLFAEMDTDGDGFLSKTECSTGHAKMKKNK